MLNSFKPEHDASQISHCSKKKKKRQFSYYLAFQSCLSSHHGEVESSETLDHSVGAWFQASSLRVMAHTIDTWLCFGWKDKLDWIAMRLNKNSSQDQNSENEGNVHWLNCWLGQLCYMIKHMALRPLSLLNFLLYYKILLTGHLSCFLCQYFISRQELSFQIFNLELRVGNLGFDSCSVVGALGFIVFETLYITRRCWGFLLKKCWILFLGKNPVIKLVVKLSLTHVW